MRKPCAVVLFSATMMIWFASADRGWAQAEMPPTLEEELLKEIEADPLDDLDRELLMPRELPLDEGKTPRERLEDELLRELGPAAVSEDTNGNPLLAIARRMREAEDLITKTQSGEMTQRVQKDIVSSLDKLLEQARKQCKKCSASQCKSQGVASRKPVKQPGQKKKPGQGEQKPSQKSVSNPNAKPGSAAAQRPDMGEMFDMLKQIWGELPEHEREQMSQLAFEEFLPKYELMIEEYFKRLAEEQGSKE